ncbi:Monoterpene epsilon-lactone hydrolase [bioreactor metagenome]|uniref:Monoterpene epsilon-lactone hydrolase n=1 Tax=bioreactor metagenome TaxID=1076179 RepID=A0A645FDP6_9ZZZZ
MHPYASPLFGTLEGLPSLFIQVGDNETLLDDSVRFAKKAKEAGVDVQLEVWPDMFHCFPLMAPMFKEADEAMERACRFIRSNFK